jgi:hypothetical protein
LGRLWLRLGMWLGVLWIAVLEHLLHSLCFRLRSLLQQLARRMLAGLRLAFFVLRVELLRLLRNGLLRHGRVGLRDRARPTATDACALDSDEAARAVDSG